MDKLTFLSPSIGISFFAMRVPYSLGKFLVLSKVLSTIVIMLHVRSPEWITRYRCNFICFNWHLPVSHTSLTLAPLFYSLFLCTKFLRFHIQVRWWSNFFSVSDLILVTMIYSGIIHVGINGRISFFKGSHF